MSLFDADMAQTAKGKKQRRQETIESISQNNTILMDITINLNQEVISNLN